MARDRQIQPVEVEVDEPALSLLGWRVSEVAARLVTTSYGKKEHSQELAVSGTAHFHPEQWSERFTNDDYAPTLLLALNRTASPGPADHTRVVWDTVRKVSKRPQRFAERTTAWECRTPLAPEDLRIRLTAFDLEEADPTFDLPPAKVTALPVEVVDETAGRSVRLRTGTATAHVRKGPYDTALRVHLEGTLAFGTASELLADHLASEQWLDPDTTLEDACPFDVQVPGLVVEVLDETGFLLEKSDTRFHSGCVPVVESGRLPRRQPRWFVDAGSSLEEYPGKPSRVVVRIMDPEDL